MRSVFIFLVMVVSSFSWAGPEDHFQSQVCYNLPYDQSKLASENIPQELCLEYVSIDLKSNQVSVYSYFHGDLYSKLNTNYLVRNTEDTYKFQLEGPIKESTNGACGESLLVTLKIDGTSDFNGENDPTDLKFEVTEQYFNDYCHSHPEIKVYQYIHFR